MPYMKNIKSPLNQPINKNIAATIIGLAGIIIPIYGPYGTDWSNAEFNVLSILLPLLWVVFVVGFIFLVLDKKGKEVTSEETDQEIVKSYTRLQKKLTPLWWSLGFGWLIWMGYLV